MTSSAILDQIRANYAVGYAGYKIDRDTTVEVEEFLAVREYFLQREVQLGRIDDAHLNDILDFKFPDDSLVATYTNPRTGAESRIAMRDVKEPAAVSVLQPYLIKSAKWQKEMGISLHAYSKGNNLGQDPLQKGKDKALGKLTLTQQDAFDKLLPKVLANLPPHLQADPGAKEIIARCFLFVDFCQNRLPVSLQEMITSREQELQGPIDPMVERRMRGEITDLKKLLKKLQNLDTYALYTALAALVSHGDLGQARAQLHAQVKADILGHTGIIFSNKELSKEQNEYALDVLALLSPDAREYAVFCRETGRPMKKESIEDIFIREAIKFARHADRTPGNEFRAENFENCIFLKDMSEGLKQEVKEKLLLLGTIATHAIVQREAGAYETPLPQAYPAGASEADQKRIDADNATKLKADEATLKGHIAAHRARVLEEEKKYRTPADLPQLANPGPLAAPVVDLGPIPGPGVLTVATAVVTAGTQLAPAIIEGGSRAIQAIGSWIPQSVANSAGNLLAMAPAVPEVVVNGLRSIQAITPLVTQPVMSVVRAVHDHPIAALGAATVADSVYSYVRPMERGPDGVARRRFKPKRALGMTAVGTAGALALYHAPQAALQSVVAAADGLKDWIFIPANVGIKLVGGLLVAEKVAKTVGSNIKERQFFKLSCLLGAGTLALLMYRAANDGVVDNSVLEIAGNWVGSQLTAVADTAYHLYNYSSATRAASMVGVSGLLAWNEGKPIKTGAIEGLFAIPMGGMPLNQLVIAGGAAADRTLPPKAAAIITVPADAAKRFTGNISMVKNGQMLGGLVVGVWGLAGKLFGKASEMAGVLGKTYEQMRETKTPVMSLI